ncbi:IclR family transcriptional regulator [Actinomycetospora sp. NBRC 106378]|uniref:IclR family transcriptional regulator n=1 Tax=Actinomycetospora sp. NBRC 106378 TaxID=3032208 RepID=UPI0024A58126|nr:IclR family transcriptional regulator [Actinomycetospora sp. NBRC 106378]GLZ53791.1 IclR family transcriptional regulator [Actinomycetospora sp. NBRC 106378]
MTVLPFSPPVSDDALEDAPLRSVSTAVAVLDCFASEAELGATKVAARLGIAKSTACRMLAALAAGGLLEKAGSGRYRLGLRLFEYGQLAVDRLLLREVAMPILGELRETVRETVQLGVAVGTDVLYLERLETAGAGLRFRTDYHRNPAHSSSIGRVLAASDPSLTMAILERGLERRTPFTVVDPRRWRQTLVQTREQGYATCRDEYDQGWSSIAAPILTGASGRRRAVAAVSVVGSTSRVLGPRKPALVQGVRRAAERITVALERAGS